MKKCAASKGGPFGVRAGSKRARLGEQRQMDVKKTTFLSVKCLRRVKKIARAHDGKYGRVLRESGGGSLNGARDEVGEAAEETTIKEVIGADKEVRRCVSPPWWKKATK